MIANNNKISAFQFGILGSYFGVALFEGVADVFLFKSAGQNAWIVAIIQIVLSLIPFFLFMAIINYEPDKNIIDKIKTLFGPKMGGLINFALVLCIAFLLVLTIWALVNFSSIKYLTETPPFFIGTLFIIAAVYATIKGIEAIVRSSEIIFYLIIIFHIIIFLSLLRFFELDNFKPVMEHGFSPLFLDSLNLLSFSVIPFILITIIPKNSVRDPKKITKFFLLGFMISTFTILLVTAQVLWTIGPDLAAIYRFPKYYVLKKINIAGAIENVENFFSTQWIFNMYFVIVISIYYLSEYTSKTLKIVEEKKKNMLIIIIGILSLFGANRIFISSGAALSFFKHQYSHLIAAIIFVIIIIINIKIYMNKHKNLNK